MLRTSIARAVVVVPEVPRLLRLDRLAASRAVDDPGFDLDRPLPAQGLVGRPIPPSGGAPVARHDVTASIMSTCSERERQGCGDHPPAWGRGLDGPLSTS